jgi:D-aminopeptidase
VGGVNHDAGESLVNALLAQFKGVAVVQVDGDGMLERLTAASMSFLR